MKLQFVWWYPQWEGFSFWRYPRHPEDKQIIFYGLVCGFFEIRYYPTLPKPDKEQVHGNG